MAEPHEHCDFHDQTPVARTDARYWDFDITEPGQETETARACVKHGQFLHDRNADAKLPDHSNEKAKALQQKFPNQNLVISPSRKVREAPQLGRSIGLEPPQRPPPDTGRTI